MRKERDDPWSTAMSNAKAYSFYSVQGQRFHLPGVGDRVWEDLDKDGQQDDGEPGVAGVDVVLRDVFGAQVNQQTTDLAGRFRFFDLASDDYYLEFTAPADFGFTTRDQGDDDVDSDVNPISGVTTATASSTLRSTPGPIIWRSSAPPAS